MPVNNVRYLKRYNYRSEQNLQAGYMREVVHQWGIDTIYFRKDLDFYSSPSGTLSNYTYGESTASTYWLTGDMIVYFEAKADQYLLNKFGIENQGNHTVLFMIDDFYEKFRDQIGTMTTGMFDIDLVGTLVNRQGFLSGQLLAEEFSGVVSGNVDLSGMSGEISGETTLPVIAQYKPVNKLIYHPRYYRYNDRIIIGQDNNQNLTIGQLYGTYYGNIDLSGNGQLSGNADGVLIYFRSPAENAGPFWGIAPQAGDFFRIDFEDGNNEEYEITTVYDRNLMTDGLNPLLGKYVWRCEVVRRDPSHEQTIAPTDEEQRTTDKSEQNTWHENVSNDIFDYSRQNADAVDTKGMDSVYGNY